MSIAHIHPYPLLWPEGVPRTASRHDSQFRVEIAKASSDLLRQLAAFAKEHVITSNVTGLSAKLVGTDPGVAVWFVRKKAVRCIACDEYRTLRENIRAISLCIEALRAMERHSMQLVDSFLQPTNAPQLPQHAGNGIAPWWAVLGVSSSATLAQAETAYRKRIVTAHPDTGGQREDFERVQEAIETARQLLK